MGSHSYGFFRPRVDRNIRVHFHPGMYATCEYLTKVCDVKGGAVSLLIQLRVEKQYYKFCQVWNSDHAKIAVQIGDMWQRTIGWGEKIMRRKRNILEKKRRKRTS